MHFITTATGEDNCGYLPHTCSYMFKQVFLIFLFRHHVPSSMAISPDKAASEVDLCGYLVCIHNIKEFQSEIPHQN